MAINYSAGFLPQALYSNMMQTQRDGLAEANQRERDRWSQLGQLGAAFVKGNINMGDKAQEAYTKNYDIQRKRLTDTMAKLDPRSGDYENYKNAITNLDAEYTTKMQDFQESGFLGNLGRDRDMLSELTNYEPGSYSPNSTAAAYALADDQTKYQNKMNTDFKMAPQIEGAKKTADLTASAEFSQSELGKAVQNAEDNRALALEKKKLALAVQADIEKRGGTYKDVAIALEKIRNAKSPEELQLKRDEMALRRDLMNTEYTNRTALENLSFKNDKERYRLQNEYTTGQIDARGKNKPAGGMTFSQYSNAKNAIKSGYKNDLNLNPKIMSGELTESDLDAMADQEVRARYQQFQNFNNPTGGANENDGQAAPASTPRMPEQPTTAPVAAPSAADLGFTPPPGQGFVSQDFLNNLDVQTTDLGNRVERLQNDSGKPMFPDLQKRADQLMVRAEQAYKEMAAAKTPEQQKAIRQKLSAVSKEIFQLSNELDKKEMESGSFRGMMRKAGQALGW
jgi:hypothetical protein